jgi:serine/threonine protein kinase
VYKAKWHGSNVAAKVLKRSDEIALGDFRTEIAILRKVHHPNCVQVRRRRRGVAWPARRALLASRMEGGAASSAGTRPARGRIASTTAAPPRQPALAPPANTHPPAPAPATTRKHPTTTRHHPAPQFLGACTKQKPYIVITELMACSLADAFLKTFYAPTQRRQVEIALDFAKGMAYLHSRRQPIVHRRARARRGGGVAVWLLGCWAVGLCV